MTTHPKTLVIVRVAERERCARIAEAVAAQYLVDGRVPRGSAGAKVMVAREIARLIRQDPTLAAPLTTPLTTELP